MNRKSIDWADVQPMGELLFERDIQPRLAGADPEHAVAIDVVTGDYVVASRSGDAMRALLARRPHAKLWMRRVGSPYLREPRLRLERLAVREP